MTRKEELECALLQTQVDDIHRKQRLACEIAREETEIDRRRLKRMNNNTPEGDEWSPRWSL